ncbi:MAG: hypothetical protein ACW98K_01175 [Candidatus Kariarchaeaceae archaeon]|jgi:hypothetical protein
MSSLMKVFSFPSTVESKYRFFAYLSILTPLGGFFLISIVESRSKYPTYEGIIPGWQNTVIAIYGILMIIIWLTASIYYSKLERTKIDLTNEERH